jgi:glycine dehydrogenase subunit 1
LSDLPFVHPYIPNSVPAVQAKMLADINASDIDELYCEIPEELRFRERMKLPPALTSESELRRHMDALGAKNRSCQDAISFLGGGSAPHYVPAICDEVNRRSEFLTAYAGEPYEDHGRFQALFEYCSMMGELLDTEVVNVPTYDWHQAASTSLRMAGRITGRKKILVAANAGPDRLSSIKNYCRSALHIEWVQMDRETGLMDLGDLRAKMDDDTAAVYFENPSYLGTVEHRGQEISDIAHRRGALCVVGVDPISLGVLAPPSQYGADITCGDLQPLGIHMYYGGGSAGFIATRDDERVVREFPSRLFGITRNETHGEWGFGDVLYNDRTSFGAREKGKEFVGTAAALWGITAGVYLALMGPKGMQEIGQSILQKSQYAIKRLSEIPGVRIPFAKTAHFKEFVVDFRETGRSTAQINADLLNAGIFGGSDLSTHFPFFENCALYCVTETHTRADIDALAGAITRMVKR